MVIHGLKIEIYGILEKVVVECNSLFVNGKCGLDQNALRIGIWSAKKSPVNKNSATGPKTKQAPKVGCQKITNECTVQGGLV